MKIIKICLIIIVFFLLIIFLGKLVSLKYINLYQEGSFISDYYKEENNHDVIFLGDCEAYTSFSPVYLFHEYGITSFVRGNSQQLIGQSYYILLETLKYETPKIVVLSIGNMRYNPGIKEEYNRLLLDKMRWSKEKIELIKYSKLKEESYLSYMFPILRYHSRIGELTKDDIDYLFKDKVVSHNGFLINQDVKPLTTLPGIKVLDNYNFSDDNINYLKKIVQLCKEKNITLILEKSPTLHPYWYPEYDKYISDFAKENNLDYYNFVDSIDDINLDFKYDTYDSGTHLNLSGAEKFTKYFGNILKEKYNLQAHLEEKIKIDYNKKYERYKNEINQKDN